VRDVGRAGILRTCLGDIAGHTKPSALFGAKPVNNGSENACTVQRGADMAALAAAKGCVAVSDCAKCLRRVPFNGNDSTYLY